MTASEFIALLGAALVIAVLTRGHWAPLVDGPEMAAQIDRALAIAADRHAAALEAERKCK